MQARPDDCLPATAYKSWDIKKANIRLCMRAFLPMLNDLALPLHAPPTPPPHSWTVRWHLGRSAHQEEKQTKQNVKALRAGISSVSTFRGTRAVSWSPTGLGVGGGGRLTFSPPPCQLSALIFSPSQSDQSGKRGLPLCSCGTVC